MHAWGSLNNGLLVLHFRPPLSHSILLLLLPPTAVSQLPPPRSHRAYSPYWSEGEGRRIIAEYEFPYCSLLFRVEGHRNTVEGDSAAKIGHVYLREVKIAAESHTKHELGHEHATVAAVVLLGDVGGLVQGMGVGGMRGRKGGREKGRKGRKGEREEGEGRRGDMRGGGERGSHVVFLVLSISRCTPVRSLRLVSSTTSSYSFTAPHSPSLPPFLVLPPSFHPVNAPPTLVPSRPYPAPSPFYSCARPQCIA